MAHIKNISYEHTGRNNGCLCQRCGQYIVNIITVQYTDGTKINMGIDCFKKIQDTGRLNAYGTKLFNKAVKWAKYHHEQYNKYISGEMTAETDESWKSYEYDFNKDCYWGIHHDDYEAYRRWMIEEVFPQRFKDDEKEFAKFGKINFAQ